MDSSSSGMQLIEQLADEFAERRERGEQPTLEEYMERYPDLASEIRDVFPALVMMEQVAPAASDLKESQRTVDAPIHSPVRQIGDYRILREIGRGGMGVVYEAEQESLRRRVALKVLPHELSASARSMERFQREARAAARMHHTNIVPVFDVGQEGDTAFYAMQLIQGQGLDLVIDDLKRLRRSHSSRSRSRLPPPESSGSAHSIAASLVRGKFQQEDLAAEVEARSFADASKPGIASDGKGDLEFAETVDQTSRSTPSAALPGQSEISTAESNRSRFHHSVAQMGIQTADALAYAHARGIIHRDIKPSNLILDAGGVVWVTDFGLAKTDDEAMTHTGDILGTMRYMSPERFQGQCDVRADIYSLGLTLYELLVLKPAFESPDQLKLIEMVRQSEPPTPRSIDPRIPRDLETIVLKSIDKDARRRYQSAEELSDDLRRFEDDQPIEARRISLPERLMRWSRRNKGVAASLTAVAFLLIAVAVGSSISARYFWESERIQRDLRAKEAEQRREAVEAKTLAERESQHAEEQRTLAQQREYGAEIQLAQNALQGENFGEADKILQGWVPSSDREDYRGWEWYYLLHRARGDVLSTLFAHEDKILEVAWSPNSKHFATVAHDGVRIWDASLRKEVELLSDFTSVPRSLSWSAEGNVLAVGLAAGSIHVFDGDSFRRLKIARTGHGFYGNLEFSRDGKYLASKAGTKLSVWDWENFELPEVVREGDVIHNMEWSPTGDHLAVFLRDGIEIWPLGEDKPILRADGRITPAGGAWSPDGSRIAVARLEVVDLLDAKNLQVLSELPAFCNSLAWDSDSNRIVTGGGQDYAVRVWDADTHHLLQTLHGHTDFISDVAWSPDGRHFVSVSWDYTVGVWMTDGQSHQDIFVGHDGAVSSVAWSPSGIRAASGGEDNTVRIWNVKSRESIHVLEGHTDVVEGVAWRSDGLRVASASRDETVRIWDVRSGKMVGKLEHDGGVRSVSWSPNGHQLASITVEGSVQLWDARTGDMIRRLVGHLESGFAIAWSADGRLVASSGSRDLWVWEADIGEVLLRRPFGGYRFAQSVAFSPSGKTLAWSIDDSVQVYDFEAKRVKKTLDGSSGRITGLAWSPDGRRLVSSSEDGTVRIWDAQQGQQLLRLSDHEAAVGSVAWSPSGQKLLTGYADGTVRIWNAMEGYRLAEGPRFREGRTVTRLRRARKLWADGNLQAADKVFTELLEVRPDAWASWRGRGATYAQRHKWDKAATDITQAINLGPEQMKHELLLEVALLRLRLGDIRSYQSVCRQLVAIASSTQDEDQQLQTAWICSLHPKTHLEVPEAAKLYHQVSNGVKGDWSAAQFKRIWITLRLRQYRLALNRSQAIEYSWIHMERLLAGLSDMIEAFASTHLGDHERARRALNRATEVWEFQRGLAIKYNGRREWKWDLALDLIHREVRQVVEQE